ncbi:MAG: hypothetical protein AB8H79_25630 [Myxococcota bacterium]
MDLAFQLTEGLQALREGRPKDAVELLAPVATDDELAAAEELQDIYARVCSLYAQALLESGRPSEARVPLRAALEALTALGDADGTRAVTELQEQIGVAITADFQEQARRRTLRALADKDPDELLAGVTSPEQKAALLVERATAAVSAGRPTEATTLAHRARDFAIEHADVRHVVLAGMVLAQAQPELALQHLEDARRRADEADEFNLVGAVAKAAEAAGLALPDHEPLS